MASTATERLARAVRAPEVRRAAVAAATVTGAAAAGKLALDRAARRRRDARRFRLRRNEPFDEEIRRVARGRIDDALDCLGAPEAGSGEDFATAVHEARKSIKRARAVVRLARPQLGEKVYRRENRALRDAGRGLAGARDAEVMLETLDELGERCADELRSDVLADLRTHLAAERDPTRAELARDGAVRERGVSALEDVRARAGAWPLDDDIAGLAAGLRRTYRRGRRRVCAARDEPSAERLHEWRKRVKDLWHAYELVHSAEPKRMKARARDAHRLSDLLGEEHDLAVLAERATSPDLRGVIGRRRTALRDEAFALGERVYRRKPRAVERRVVARWRRRAAAAA